MASRAAATLLNATPSPPLPSQPNQPKPGAASQQPNHQKDRGGSFRGRRSRRHASGPETGARLRVRVHRPRPDAGGGGGRDKDPLAGGPPAPAAGGVAGLAGAAAGAPGELLAPEAGSLHHNPDEARGTEAAAEEALLRHQGVGFLVVDASSTEMDYAARSKDAGLVQEHYHTVVATLEEILGMI